MALIFLFLLLAFFPIATPRHVPATHDSSMLLRHEQWMAQFGRVYDNTTEKAARFEIFKHNVEFIESFNANSTHKYRLGINEFADLTKEEFNAMVNNTYFTTPPEFKAESTFSYGNNRDVPDTKDWRTEGVITPVKNQLGCGCCWAFASVATVEAITAINTGTLVSLSEQQLVDCDTQGHNNGCQGGSAAAAFQFIIDNGGLTTEESYSYQGHDGNVCVEKSSAARITSYERVPNNDERELMLAVANQPVYASILVGSDEFRTYTEGVFEGPCGSAVNHAVAVIGYGMEDDGTKYWLVKNSWGSSWGEGGFGKIAREAGPSQGVCSMARNPTYPVA